MSRSSFLPHFAHYSSKIGFYLGLQTGILKRSSIFVMFLNQVFYFFYHPLRRRFGLNNHPSSLDKIHEKPSVDLLMIVGCVRIGYEKGRFLKADQFSDSSRSRSANDQV